MLYIVVNSDIPLELHTSSHLEVKIYKTVI